MWNTSDICEQTLQIKIAFAKKLEKSEVTESLHSFGADFFDFQFAIQKYKL
jgi:hypothetical protein